MKQQIAVPRGHLGTAQSHTSQRRWLTLIPAYVVLGLWGGFTVFSLGWVIVASFKTNQEVFRAVFAFPNVWQIDNYVRAWNASDFGTYFVNSVIVTTLSVLGLLVVSAPAAYVLSRIKFRGRTALLTLFTAGMGIPFALVLIPLYVMLSSLQLINQLHGLILVYMSLSIPFTVYVLTGFFGSLPNELEEAAIIDGCSDIQVFRYVMLPLASPGLLTVAIFNGIDLWNEYQLVLAFVSDGSKRTLSLGLYALQSSMQYTGDWVGLFAGVTIIMLPTIALYIVLSEKMISGITMGAVK